MTKGIEERLDKVRSLIQEKDFLEGRGLSNEVNIRIFCYEPEEEMAVRHFIKQLLSDQALPCRVLENNLYDIFLSCCEEKRILGRMESMESKKGKAHLHQQIVKAVGVQDYIKKICEKDPHRGDVILLTGVGTAFPFIRVHMLLEALQPKVPDVPILVMYPGTFDGRHVKLFDKLPANSYYRAFSAIDWRK